MIDDPRKTDLLMSMLTEALPIEANVTQYLADELMEKSPEIAVCARTKDRRPDGQDSGGRIGLPLVRHDYFTRRRSS
jgi:hypothetical protein